MSTPEGQPGPDAGVRPFDPADIPAVAAMFQKIMLGSKKPAPATLERCLQETFLDHPRFDPELPSRVYIDAAGTIGGFIGVLPSPMTFRGEPLRAAIAGSLMVENPAQNPLAGARLLRSVRSGPQDITISETANDVSMGMWERMGDSAVAQYSLQWVRVFRPAAFATAMASDRIAAARLLGPVAAVADLSVKHLTGRSSEAGDVKPLRSKRAQAGRGELASLIKELAQNYALRPEWDDEALAWMLSQAQEKSRYGDMRSHIVLSPSGKVLGCYVYYLRSGGIAWVLQVLAHPKAHAAVVESLLEDARAGGAAAIRGRVQPETIAPLMRRKAFFVCNASMVVHTRRSELLDTVNAGDALITGLAAESWIRLIGNRFT
ncbi:hypothetical protein [Hoeflea prorocentri]|uniref:Uncharacterized protein n=1 Tax=Hoeflea prorocentri TaxID=1922333 RepID=A0A9X3UI00_9HYPH|nr:hypothetical protein [Hoeflea prorocentri]MCY6381753.1 hypothetical protein [Hoeflea prorocentri]MDA5399553.1 hypothetical protein [Hoeflea prorocentri]